MKNTRCTFSGFWLPKYLSLLLLCIITTNSYSQSTDLKFSRLTVRDGLSHNNVYAIVQDKYGYLWFGTQDGLNRYDGKKIKIFRNEVDNNNSLSTSNFGKILIDRAGNYWFGTFGGGVDRYDPVTNTFKNFSYLPNDSNSISNNQIIFIFEDSKGDLWFGTPDGGVNRYNRNNENFTRFKHFENDPNSLSGNRAKCMCETPDGTLWFGTENGLNRFDSASGSFHRYTHNPNTSNSLSGNFIQNMIANDDGTIWIVTHGGGLNHFDPTTTTFKRYTHNSFDSSSLSDDKADCILKDSNGNLWIGTYEGGLNKFDPTTGRFTHYKNDPNNDLSISSNRIEYLFEDNSKVLWIGTRGGGLNKIDLKPKKFNNLRHDPTAKQSLPQHSIMAIGSDSKGSIWIGSDGGGLTQFNTQKQQFNHFTNMRGNENSLSNNRVWSVFVDSNEVIWTGTYQGGLNRIERRGDEFHFKNFVNNPSNKISLSSNQINCIFQDNEGQLWFGTAQGLNKLVNNDDSNYIFKSYRHSPFNHTFKTNDNYVNSIIQDMQGRLWVGSYQSGLYEFDPINEEFKHFVPNIDDSLNFLKTLNLMSLFCDSKGDIWIGTESRGLLKLDIEKRLTEEHPNNQELKSKTIIGMVEDDYKNLWIVTTGELYRYSISDSSFISFSYDDGIEVNGFNRNSFHKSSDGQLYFGGNAALTYFHPNQVTKNPYIPKVTITDFKVLSKSIWDNSLIPFVHNLHFDNRITLTHKDYLFSIEFASLDFTNSQKNQFFYTLEGFNNEWIEAGSDNSVTFTNLNPGKYTFKVKGSNNDLVWNEDPVEFEIYIVPPFWKRTWFIIAQTVALVLLIVSYIRYRTYRLRKDKSVLESRVKDRTKELHHKNKQLESALEKLKSTQIQLIQSEKMATIGVLTSGISHEINNPLNFIHGGVTILEKYVNENLQSHQRDIVPLVDIIVEGVVRATNIIQTLDQFSRETDSYTNTCDVKSIIDNCLFMLKQRFVDRVIVKTNYSEGLPPIRGNEGRLHQMFFNILFNADQSIETNGEISISTKVEGSNIQIVIADSGCGIRKELISKITDPFFTTKEPGEGVGLGLSLVYAIVKEHRGTISFESEEHRGTTVLLNLPIRCE
jgi:ligand-binding sensor domain-containing protein/signal transduction histidine kinase